MDGIIGLVSCPGINFQFAAAVPGEHFGARLRIGNLSRIAQTFQYLGYKGLPVPTRLNLCA